VSRPAGATGLEERPLSPTASEGDRRGGPHPGVTVAALVLWGGLVTVSRVWGLAVVEAATEPLHVGAVPFFGRWDLAPWPALLPAALVLLLASVLLPWFARRLTWGRLLAATAAVAVVVSVGLALVEPPSQRWQSVQSDYGQHIDLVEQQGAGGFLRDYTDHQVDYPTHLSAHPPGMVVLLWAQDQIALGGTVGQVGTVMAGVAATVVATLTAVRAVAGQVWARATAPFVVIAPAAVWHTNADVVFAAISLAGVALVAVATTRSGTPAVTTAAAGGATLGLALLFSQGMVLMALPAAAVLVAHRRGRLLVAAAAAGLAVIAVPWAWGYSYLAGLHATKEAYDLNLARVRPYGYFVVANLAVLAVALGPGTAVALARLRERGVWVLVGAALGTVLLADLSGLSLAETERIWQPFMPLVLVSGGVLAIGGPESGRGWLALQAAATFVLVAVLRSPW
jgi:hypothetical protein